MIKQLLAALLFTTIYAVLRYAGFGNVSLIHVPVYLMNKSLSMAATASLFMAALGLMRSQRDAVSFWGRACLHLVFVHVLLSLSIFSKGYYAKFFDNDKMNLIGEAVVLLGVLAVYCVWRLGSAEIKPALRRTLTVLASGLVAGHIFVMGYDGWLQFQKWHGGLPPITLLSFLMVMYSLVVFLWAKEKYVSLSSEDGLVRS